MKMQPYGDRWSRIAPKEARFAPRCTSRERGMLTQSMYKKLAALLLVAGISDPELTRNIQSQLSKIDYGSRRPVVAVSGGVVTVTGTVVSLWLKEETINRIL